MIHFEKSIDVEGVHEIAQMEKGVKQSVTKTSVIWFICLMAYQPWRVI